MLRDSIKVLKSRPQLYQAKLGVYLFIASLGVFFFASLIVYAVIRTSLSIDLLPLEMPNSFLTSTLVLLGVSLFMHLAVQSIKTEKQNRFRAFLVLTSICVLGFLFLQCFGLFELLQTHFEHQAGFSKLYGISFTLALVHAAHVFGGAVFLGYVWMQSLRGRYDHERHWTVDICATYWHFLDVIWILMLCTFWMTENLIQNGTFL